MTEVQVFEILGGEGDLITESGDFKTFTYDGQIAFAKESITIQEDR